MSSIISKLINLAGNITGVLPIANGGTNSSTTLNNNRFIVSSSGSIDEAAAVTASRVVVSDSNGLPTAATTSTTQVQYLASATGTTGTTSTNVVFSTSPTLVTPVLGTPASGNLSNCTSYPNVTQTIAGLVSSAGQLLGTNTNDSASAGNVGEVLSASVSSSSPSSLTTATAKSLTSITLTAGDWDVRGGAGFTFGSTTSVTALHCACSTSNNTDAPYANYANPGSGQVGYQFSYAAQVLNNDTHIGVPTYQTKVANGNTLQIYLTVTATFTVSTCSAYGYIQARRMR